MLSSLNFQAIIEWYNSIYTELKSFSSTILYSPEKPVCAEEKFPPYKVKMTSDVNQTVFQRRFYSSKISQESKRHEKKGLVSRDCGGGAGRGWYSCVTPTREH